MRAVRALVDKSAIEIATRNHDAHATIVDLAARNEFLTSATVALEVLCSARSKSEYEAWQADLKSLPWLESSAAVAKSALDIQGLLAGRGRHRISIRDLLVAATALEHDVALLHYDKHYDLIAEVTGLQSHWIVPRGSGH